MASHHVLFHKGTVPCGSFINSRNRSNRETEFICGNVGARPELWDWQRCWRYRGSDRNQRNNSGLFRTADKFAGNKLRVRLRLLKVIDPIIDRKHLLSRPDLRGLSILRCPRGTNFRVRPEEVKVLEDLIESRSASTRILAMAMAPLG
jgi:hypothetical protein